MGAGTKPGSRYRHAGVCLRLGTAGLATGIMSLSFVALTPRIAAAATDTVTNCSASASTAGSLPYEVAHAGSGDTIDFALSPACSTIAVGGATINITKDLSIVGPGASALAVVGNGTAPVFSVQASINSTSFSGLTIKGGGGSSGGGIANGGFILTVANSIITGNSGGGITTGGLSLTVTDSTISGNSAPYGGGIANDNCGGGAIVTGSTISQNTAMFYGGGVYNCGAITISNSTLSGNMVTDAASGSGGGLYNALGGGAGATLTNDTVWNNHAKKSSGLDNEASAANLSIGATSLADNTSISGPGQDCGNHTLTDLGYNLDADGSCGLTAAGDLSGVSAGFDPSGLQYNGGPTETIALDPGSPAIDHVPAAHCPATDQRGVTRAAPCDIGAYDTDSEVFGPILSSVSPATGYTTGGTAVTLTGSGFTGATSVDFGGIAATHVAVHSATLITATSPADSAGIVDVTVLTPGGTSALTPADQFTYTVLASPTPPASCDPSCTVAVRTPLEGTTVQVMAASTAPMAKVTLVTNTGTLNCRTGYNYVAPVTTLTPTGFPSNATVTVSQTMTNQPTTSGVKVCFQAKGAPTPVVIATCGTPKKAPCLLSLTEAAGNKVTAKFLSPAKDPKWRVGGNKATVTSFSPTSVARRATLTVVGTNLTQVTSVIIGGAKAAVKSVTATKIVVNVPQSARTGLITVSGNFGLAVSSKTVTVT